MEDLKGMVMSRNIMDNIIAMVAIIVQNCNR